MELQQAAAAGAASGERWMRRKDGSLFFAFGVTTALRDKAGRLLGFTRVMRDQTDRKQLEDQLRRVADEVSNANRRKDECSAIPSPPYSIPCKSSGGPKATVS
jgi:two-component system CheB/CheR fusion protein